MRTSIDWLSFSFPVNNQMLDAGDKSVGVIRALGNFVGVELASWLMEGEWRGREKGRAPYTESWARDEAGMMLFSSPNLNHATIEFSGQGCDYIERHGRMTAMLAAAGHRCTRLDIACDIETSMRPLTFVEAARGKRFKTLGDYRSQSGETIYVGSQKSERFCRVYRYAPPHPRSQYLRVEYVFRREYAKRALRQVLDGTLSSVATRAALDYGWAHIAWDNGEGAAANVVPQRTEGAGGGTERWLLLSAAPAFKRLVRQGVIKNPEQWLRDNMLDG